MKKNLGLKPFGFCCSIHDFDPLTKYNQPKSQSSVTSICAVNECPVLKFQAEYADNDEPKKRTPKSKPFDIADQKRNPKHKQSLGQSQNVHRQYKSNNPNNPRNPNNPHNPNNANNLHNPRNFGDHAYNPQNVGNPSNDQSNVENLYDERVMRHLQGPLKWYLEDEIAAAQDILIAERQYTHNEQMHRNLQIGKERLELLIKKDVNTYPRWYQDFSIDQINDLMMLQSVIYKDCEEMVTGRTQRTLVTIGVTSTFFTLPPDAIKKLQKSSNCSAIDFLRETYRILTGNYFEDEEYKQFYDCNERIILSAIAFLTLPEAVVELHKRLPNVIMPKLPAKPVSPTIPARQKMESPYAEELFERPDWATYRNDLTDWKEQCKLIPIPKIILPPTQCILTNYKNTLTNSDTEYNERNEIQNLPRYSKTRDTGSNPPARAKHKRNSSSKEEEKRYISTALPVKAEKKAFTNPSTNNPTEEISKFRRASPKRKRNIENQGSGGEIILDDSANAIDPNAPRLPNESKVFDFTINGISDTPGPVEYKICGVLQPPRPNEKSWLGEKHAHFIVSGADDNPPTCPVTYEMSGVANVTPTNSDERFFSVLKIGDGPNKIYPSGRANLSPQWQEWLQDAEEEFRAVEREANDLIKRIEAVTKLVFPGPMCDSCCSCRQTRKTYIKSKETKAPYLVVDSLTEDDKKNKYIVGSMAMHSPAPTPPESTVNLLEVIASEDVLKPHVLINGVTNGKTGETNYFITGFKEDIVRVPARIVERSPPRPPRIVPPCACAIQQILKKGLESEISHDHIPWTKEDGLCFGNKFRPKEYPAYSCQMYPGDKSCRRNPFMPQIMQMKRKAERERQEREERMSKKEKKMYSIAEFQPCGEEHGLAICKGPWGAMYTLTPEELEEQERKRKEILRGPPCGQRPGRAVCEGPFGERVPEKRQQIEIEEMPGEDDEDIDEEEEVEEEEEVKPPPKVGKIRERTQDEKCYVSPEAIAGRRPVVVKKVEKFIPDPNYPGYDEPWNVFRTAPSEKPSETDFKKLLKLSSPKPPATPVESEMKIDVEEEPSLQKAASVSVTKKDTFRASAKDLRKKSPSAGKATPSRTTGSPASARPKSLEKVSKTRSGLVVKKSATGVPPKPSATPATIQRTPDKLARGKADSEIKRERVSKPKGSKHSQGKVTEKITPQASKPVVSSTKVRSSRERTSPQTSKSVVSSTKVRSSREKTRPQTSKASLQSAKSKSPRGKSRRRSGSRTKQDERAVPKKPRTSVFETGRKSSTHRDRSRRRSSIKGREAKAIKKVHSKQPSSIDTGKRKLSKRRSRRSSRRGRRRTSSVQDGDSISVQRKRILGLKRKLASSELYPHDVQPAEPPEEPPLKCTLEYEIDEDTEPPAVAEEEADPRILAKGPCGWRTKSEQALPTKKTLVYLSEPDQPIETIPVRPGGKPCTCRAIRATKKILMYNIGGLVGGKKEDTGAAIQKKLLKKKKDDDDKDEKSKQMIDGAIYYTPPLSPRRSDEYVPEYDLYESPYDMCLSQRKDTNLKFLERHSDPIDEKSKLLKDTETCGCNEYVDTYGVQPTEEDNAKELAIKELDDARRELMDSAAPKDRWKHALTDLGLIDYFSRCRDNMPCWLKCAKFNKVGCALRRPKLKLKRPVCECKYERKILENKEEKRKWKERRQRLKSLKKEPVMNVVNVSKPVIAETKLMISGVKRIPMEDEYVDDVKYCITGVAENYTELPPEPVVGGVQMATPLRTPEPSEEKIPCVCLHRHWSPIDIPPGPLPREEDKVRAEKERRQRETEETYNQIYAPQQVYDTHIHSCETPCGADDSSVENHPSVERSSKIAVQDRSNKGTPYTQRSTADDRVRSKARNKSPNPPGQIKKQLPSSTKNPANESGTKNVTRKAETTVNQRAEKKNARNEASVQKSVNNPRNQIGNQAGKSSARNIGTRVSRQDPDKENNESANNTNADSDLMITVQNELEKMAVEGFLFAKLPKCFLLPQLQYWLMYREGIVITSEDKNNTVRKSIMLWNTLDSRRPPSIQPLPLQLTKLQLRHLTFDRANEMNEKIAKKKDIFYSQVRKERVLYSQSMWNTMEYGKFPTTSFKRAYFTYLASKEADGHVYKPWLPYEVRET